MEYKINTAARIDARLELSGSGVTGLAAGDLVVKWSDFNTTSWETLTATTHYTLVELGEGDYIIIIGAGVTDAAGPMRIKVSSAGGAFDTVQYSHSIVSNLVSDVINAGAGANTVTLTFNDGANPLAGVVARVYTESGMSNLVATVTSNVSGTGVVYLDDGTFYVQQVKSGYSFTIPETLVVSGTSSDTYSGTALAGSGTTLADLKAYARMRIAGSSTSKATTMITSAINNAIKRVGREDFYEFLRPGRINLVDTYSTGTVTMSNGSAVVTGSGTAWQTAGVAAGDKLIVSGDTNVEFEVLTVDGETQLTLRADQEWMETTAASLGYTIYRDLYALPSAANKAFRKMYQPEGEDFSIQFISPPDFYEMKLRDKNNRSTTPYCLTVVNSNFQVYPYPADAQVVDYLYYAWPDTLTQDTDTIDLSEKKLPLLHRAIDMELALFPGVDIDEGVAAAMYDRFLTDFMSADRKAWRKVKIRNPHVAGGTGRYRGRYPYGDVTIT